MKAKDRMLRVQEQLKEQGLDAILITHLPNIFYLTGFTGSSAALLIHQQDAVFFTDGRYREQAIRQVTNALFRQSRKGLLFDAAHEILRCRFKKTGVESRHLSYESLCQLRKSMARKGGLVRCVDWVENMRSVKTGAEIEKIQNSLNTVMMAFEETLPLVKPGVRESELSAELEYRMKRKGAEKASFDLIVASGYRSALPHGIASAKKVLRNEFLVFDLGAILCGYSSDFTRTVYVGRPPRKAREIYEIVLEGQECAIAGVRAGVSASHIDRLARRAITRRGYGKYFVHSTGHGIGIEVHEAPAISARSAAILQADQTITIEPGIYLPCYGGVRIEDIVVVGERGCRNLTRTSKELITL
jgi:Xaa-Pro aminopeptidase